MMPVRSWRGVCDDVRRAPPPIDTRAGRSKGERAPTSVPPGPWIFVGFRRHPRASRLVRRLARDRRNGGADNAGRPCQQRLAP